MNWLPFNINDSVRVRLTAFGHQTHRSLHDERAKQYALLASGAAYPWPYIPVPEDGEGWSVWQLWCLMETFGPVIHHGGSNPFETKIEISQP